MTPQSLKPKNLKLVTREFMTSHYFCEFAELRHKTCNQRI